MTTLLKKHRPLSHIEYAALEVIALHPEDGRSDEFLRRNLGKYGPGNPLVQLLLSRGHIEVVDFGRLVVSDRGIEVLKWDSL